MGYIYTSWSDTATIHTDQNGVQSGWPYGYLLLNYKDAIIYVDVSNANSVIDGNTTVELVLSRYSDFSNIEQTVTFSVPALRSNVMLSSGQFSYCADFPNVLFNTTYFIRARGRKSDGQNAPQQQQVPQG